MSPRHHLHKTQIKPVGAPFVMASGDLLLDIALFLETRLDVLNFCLTVRPVL